jgi:hypothetical protein
MVTSKLTAAAVQAQITSQKQRLAALDANLRTMESGMDKHMVQVQKVCMDTSCARLLVWCLLVASTPHNIVKQLPELAIDDRQGHPRALQLKSRGDHCASCPSPLPPDIRRWGHRRCTRVLCTVA